MFDYLPFAIRAKPRRHSTKLKKARRGRGFRINNQSSRDGDGGGGGVSAFVVGDMIVASAGAGVAGPDGPVRRGATVSQLPVCETLR